MTTTEVPMTTDEIEATRLRLEQVTNCKVIPRDTGDVNPSFTVLVGAVSVVVAHFPPRTWRADVAVSYDDNMMLRWLEDKAYRGHQDSETPEDAFTDALERINEAHHKIAIAWASVDRTNSAANTIRDTMNEYRRIEPGRAQAEAVLADYAARKGLRVVGNVNMRDGIRLDGILADRYLSWDFDTLDHPGLSFFVVDLARRDRPLTKGHATPAAAHRAARANLRKHFNRYTVKRALNAHGGKR